MGLLDVTFRDNVAPLLIDQFTDNPLLFERTTRVYNAMTGVTTPTTVNVSIKASPPVQWTEEELQTDPLRHSMLKVYVAQLTVDNAGVVLTPGTEASVYCTRGGVRYVVIPVKRFASGDQDALLALGLSK